MSIDFLNAYCGRGLCRDHVCLRVGRHVHRLASFGERSGTSMARACVRRYSSWRWRSPPRRLRLLKLSLSSRLPFTHRASGDAGSSFVRSVVGSVTSLVVPRTFGGDDGVLRVRRRALVRRCRSRGVCARRRSFFLIQSFDLRSGGTTR